MNDTGIKFRLLAATILIASWTVVFAGDLPEKRLTPGAINPSVTQANIQATVCVKGFTKTIRPPTYFTNKLKKIQIEEYGYKDQNPSHYEEDHLIPLSIGGNPDSPLNLWPQPRISEWDAEKKDVLELKIQKMVCAGELSLDQARKEIAEDWIAAYKKYIGN